MGNRPQGTEEWNSDSELCGVKLRFYWSNSNLNGIRAGRFSVGRMGRLTRPDEIARSKISSPKNGANALADRLRG